MRGFPHALVFVFMVAPRSEPGVGTEEWWSYFEESDVDDSNVEIAHGLCWTGKDFEKGISRVDRGNWEDK